MPSWTVEISEAAEREIRDLPPDLQGRFLHISEMLKELGPQRVGMPHVRSLGQELWEMRMSGRDGIARAIYFATRGRRLVVVRVFVKKSRKTPRREIELASRRMKEVRNG
jgi:phage-related protein